MWQIADATGWSVDYILNGVNYQTLIMMLSDAPRYRRVRKGGRGGHVEADGAPQPIDAAEASAEAEEILGFFQSKLK